MFEKFLEASMLLEGSMNDNFCTERFEMTLEINETGRINTESERSEITFDSKFSQRTWSISVIQTTNNLIYVL